MSENGKVKKKKEKPTRGGVEPIHAVVVYVPNEIRLKEIYKAYGVWKHLPPLLGDLNEMELATRFGIRDEQIVKLLQIKTHTAFAKEYGVNRQHLYDWDKKLHLSNPFDWIAVWAKGALPNITIAMIQNAMGKGGTSFVDRQTAFKTLAGYEDKSAVRIEGLAEGILAAMKQKKKLADADL